MKTADLLKKIEALEARVRELEARPTPAPVMVPYPVSLQQPAWPSTWPNYHNPFGPTWAGAAMDVPGGGVLNYSWCGTAPSGQAIC